MEVHLDLPGVLAEPARKHRSLCAEQIDDLLSKGEVMPVPSQAQRGRTARPNPTRTVVLQREYTALPIHVVAAAFPRAMAHALYPATALVFLYEARAHIMLM